MSTLFQQAISSERPSFGAPLVLSGPPAAAPRSAFPLDRVLSGMVAAGQGIEAICLFLGLSRILLDSCLVRLGLPTPHDRPLRRAAAKPGSAPHAPRRPWSVFDTMCVIAWRVAGIHPTIIAVRLHRSPGAIRAKSRRLGIPAPRRAELRRVDPATLVAPAPDYAAAAAAPIAGIAACGTRADAAGAFSAQRELRLLRDILSPATPAVDLPQPAVLPQRGRSFSPAPPALAAEIPGVTTPTPLRDNGLAAKALLVSAKDWPRNRDVVGLLSLRYFGRQHDRAIAAEFGLTRATLASFFSRIDLPRDLTRKKFGGTYDEALARANLEKSGYHLATCAQSKRLFWRHKRDRATVRCNREARRLNLTHSEPYQCSRITV